MLALEGVLEDNSWIPAEDLGRSPPPVMSRSEIHGKIFEEEANRRLYNLFPDAFFRAVTVCRVTYSILFS
jgi:hypothetical protein